MNHDDLTRQRDDESPQQSLLTIAQAAAASGINPHTLGYHERAGVVAVPSAPSGQRRHGPPDLRAVQFINRLRGTGLPILQIEAYADAARTGRDAHLGTADPAAAPPEPDDRPRAATQASRGDRRKSSVYPHSSDHAHPTTTGCQEN